jgi:hypothetical protein
MKLEANKQRNKEAQQHGINNSETNVRCYQPHCISVVDSHHVSECWFTNSRWEFIFFLVFFSFLLVVSYMLHVVSRQA